MEKKTALAIRFELIWWIITALVTALVMYPIVTNFTVNPFLLGNVLLIVIFITFTRYIFLLPYTFFSDKVMWKVVIGVLAIFVCIFCLERVHSFQVYADETDMSNLLEGYSEQSSNNLLNYFRSEYLLFGVGAIVAAVALTIRLIISVWKQRNKIKISQ